MNQDILVPNKTPMAPLAERRGLQGRFHHDLSFYTLMVEADIDVVTDSFAREVNAKKVRKGAPREKLPDCDVFGSKFFPFQYRGHSWTNVVHRYDDDFSPALARNLSAKLHTQAIFAGSHDTVGTYDCILYKEGKLAEVFHFHEATPFRLLTPDEFKELEKDALKNPSGYYAASNVRELDVADFQALTERKGKFKEHLEHLFDDFFRRRDAFRALNRGDEGTEYFPLYDATDDEIVRIDVVDAGVPAEAPLRLNPDNEELVARFFEKKGFPPLPREPK